MTKREWLLKHGYKETLKTFHCMEHKYYKERNMGSRCLMQIMSLDFVSTIVGIPYWLQISASNDIFIPLGKTEIETMNEAYDELKAHHTLHS